MLKWLASTFLSSSGICKTKRRKFEEVWLPRNPRLGSEGSTAVSWRSCEYAYPVNGSLHRLHPGGEFLDVPAAPNLTAKYTHTNLAQDSILHKRNFPTYRILKKT